uniref:ETF domain-containing protein n=1 Tax=Caenorhabditis japonica TaxID=281687 RepID=A0A8R1I6Z4_CAEJA
MLSAKSVLNRTARFVNASRLNSTLVVAEHDDSKLAPITLNAITAANKLGNEVSVLVTGANAAKVAEQVAKVNGVKRVLVAQDDKLKNNLPERVAPVVLASQKQFNFSAITAGSSAFGRGVIPRVAATLDVSPISDITEVHSADSFTRTQYAGNAVKKVKSSAPVKLLTFRGTAFEPAKEGGSGAVENGFRKRSGSASGMSFTEHMEAIKKEMSTMSSQLGSNKTELERNRQEMSQIQLQVQQLNETAVQDQLNKAHEMTKRLEGIARNFVATINDQSQQAQLLAELESISKNGTPQMPVMTPPMMNAAVAAAMHPNMMMRNPMLNAMSGASPRVGKGGAPNGGMNGMMFQQMQLAQMQAQAAMMQAHMFPGMQLMGVPGMLPGMPPGMAGLPGMMPPSSAAAAAAMQQFTQQAQMAAAAIAVSTPSRNHSTSGAASRTRTPLTASATNSPRPTPVTETVIKEEDPPSMESDVPVSATTSAIKQEENSTVAVA